MKVRFVKEISLGIALRDRRPTLVYVVEQVHEIVGPFDVSTVRPSPRRMS